MKRKALHVTGNGTDRSFAEYLQNTTHGFMNTNLVFWVQGLCRPEDILCCLGVSKGNQALSLSERGLDVIPLGGQDYVTGLHS